MDLFLPCWILFTAFSSSFSIAINLFTVLLILLFLSVSTYSIYFFVFLFFFLFQLFLQLYSLSTSSPSCFCPICLFLFYFAPSIFFVLTYTISMHIFFDSTAKIRYIEKPRLNKINFSERMTRIFSYFYFFHFISFFNSSFYFSFRFYIIFLFSNPLCFAIDCRSLLHVDKIQQLLYSKPKFPERI